MTTTLEANDLKSQKFEVNSNIRIGGDELAGERAGPNVKVVKCDAVVGDMDDKKLELNDKKQEGLNHKSDVIEQQENGSGALHVNGETVKSLDTKMNVVNGGGTPDESGDVSPSPAGVSDSPAGCEPPSKNSTESPTALQEQLDGETDSIDSGKSPKKKKGLLSGGLHLHLPKFSSRLSFGSDVSGTSTGSDLDGSPDKKKKKKGKKHKKKLNLTVTNDQGDQENNATPSEYSESVASERVDPLDTTGTASMNDLGLDSLTENQDQEKLPSAQADDQASSSLVADEGEHTQDATSDATKVSSPEPVAEPESVENKQIEKMDVNESSQEEMSPAEEADTKAAVSPEQSVLPTHQSEPTPCPPSNADPSHADQETPPEAVEESKQKESTIDQVEQSTSNLGEPSTQEGEEEIVEEKKGSTSSGEEGEEEDEGELEEGKQKKKKKRKGILNVHFPHFGGKKGKSGEKSSDQSSDSDRALSPKRFGWKKRKDARSPERREDKQEELDVANKEDGDRNTVEVKATNEEAEKQEGEKQSDVAVPLDVDFQEPDVKVPDVALSQPEVSVEDNVRPEEKLLAECKEYLVQDEGEEKALEESTGEDFTTTDALLEQIAETITSIEKAQNLRNSQAMDVNVVADTAPAAEQDEGLDLHADIPSNVDEQAINIPSAQITLAVPTESTLLEVSDEEKADNQGAEEVKEEGTTELDGAADAKETQEGEALSSSSPGKSPRFKLHLPKFHLPKMHLSGKKDKKKVDTTQGEEANMTKVEEEDGKHAPSQDTEAVAPEVQERLEGDGAEAMDGSDTDVKADNADKTDISSKADIGVTVNMDAKTDVGVTVNMDDPDGMVPEIESVDEKIPVLEGSVTPSVEAPNVSVNDSKIIEPKLDSVIEAEVPSAGADKDVDVAVAMPVADTVATPGGCDPSASLELNGPDVDTKCAQQDPEQLEVVVVMNEVMSEEDEVIEDTKVEAPSEEPVDGKAKSTKKGRFKMPSINFHMPKFGGSKKSYKVDANAGPENCIVEEGKVNGIVQLEGPDVIPEAEGELQTKMDAEVNAGGGDLSIELPEVLDTDTSECKQEVPEVNKLDNGLPDDKGIAVAVFADAEFEKPSINIDSDACQASIDHPSLNVNVHEEITSKTEAPSLEVPENVDIACKSEEAPSKDILVPEMETNAEGPSVSVTVEEPPLPALDQEASIKAKKKGLSLPTMHFRPKFTGKKWSRHPRFRSKAKESKSLSASSKVTTSLPNVATTTALETPLPAEEMRTRRASDVIDPKIAADIAAEHEISAAGDIDETPQKSKKSKFRFPSLHFSLPRFSSLMSPHKSQNSDEVEEPEMTELKPDVDTLDITAEADIPKTNLDVVMPEISGMTESAPEVNDEEAVGAVGGIEDPEPERGVPNIDTATSPLSVTSGVSFPEVKLEVSQVTEVSPPDIKAIVPGLMDENAAEVAAKANLDLSTPEAAIPNVDGADCTDVAAAPEIEVDATLELPAATAAVESPELNTDAANTSTETKKGKKKSFLPNMHLPKLNIKGTPMKFRSKGKKATVETPDVEGEVKACGEVDANVSMETPTSPDLSMIVNTSGEPSVTVDADAVVPKVDVEAKETPKTLLEISAAAADANVVKKSEIDVKSPSIATEALVSGLPFTDANVPKGDVSVELDGQGKASAPDVSGDLPDSMPLSGTVVIAYDTIVEPGFVVLEAPKENIDGEGKVIVATPDIDGDSGATNQVLDLALGGGGVGGMDQENNADLHISSSDNEGTDTKQKQKKKKKRKGLHMPSINLPKFHLRHDKKPASNVDVNLPDVVVPDSQVDGADVNVAGTPEVVVPETDLAVKAEPNVGIEADEEQKLDPPSAIEAAAVVACVAMEVGPPEVEVPSGEENPKASLPSDLPQTVGESLTKVEDTPNVEVVISPKVDQVVEAVVPSVCQAVTETIPDTAVTVDVGSEDATLDTANRTPDDAPAQLEVEDSGLDADTALDDSSTSKPTKPKKARMPKINFPKMNFKLSPHKSEVTSPAAATEEVDGTDDPSLTPAEIDQIEGSIQSGQAQATVPMVEINGGSAEVADDESTPAVKKGKYKKRIGGIKLKRIRGKSKGKSPVTEDIKGEGLTAGVSLEVDGELNVDAGVDGLENGLCTTQDADSTLDSDSPLVHTNDLITSTPIKPTLDSRLCKNNSAQQANSEPSTPESMNIDAAITINSLPATPEAVSPIAATRPFWVVVAIDFGTTFSGYAYSLTQEPETVHIMRKWEGGDPGVTNMKTPTTLLLTPEGEFHSFGFTARDFYHDMDHKEAVRWLYFDKFKLTLHGDPNLNMKTEIKAANGQSFPAATVFEHSLRFFHDHAVDELCDQSMDGEVDPRDIRWVLTVPAIWKQPAKQFMRQAAYKAGLASPSRPDQLLIALEPEAASIYIRKLRLRELAPEHQSQRQKWLRSSTGKITKSNSKVSESIRHGTRYMVVDCGGGTVDITVHEVEEGLGTLKELHKAAGGRYGSVSIDQEFEQLLVDIFSLEFLEEFKVKRPAGWVDLMIAFEARKRNASPWKNNPLNVSLPFSFIDYYKKYTNGKQMEEAVRRYNSKDVTWSAQVPGMLRFTPEGMQRLFASTVERLITGVEQVLSSPSLTGISYLFVVGGFAQSALLQSAIRKKFSSQMRIIIPRDLGLSILKGAVLFGLDPSAVRVRRSRLTYGVGVLNKFLPGTHPEEKKVSKDNTDWCKDIFDTFVQADESVAVGDKVTRSYTPAKPSQQAIIINIYCSDRENVRFITDEGVRKCGTLHIDVTDSQYSGMRGRRELQLTMQYGDTEIKVSALDVPTGKCVKSNIDFLNK